MTWIWQHIMFAPLLNLLVWLYNNAADQNLGIAVIELTILLRVVLLPLSIVSERDSYKYDLIAPEVERVNEESRHDPVVRKERIRELLKKRKLHPWAKAWGLILQGLVLVVLYRVFVSGINAHLDVLYSWVTQPAFINVDFLGQDIGERSALWAGFVAFWLFFQIHLDQRRAPGNVTRNDVLFSLFFPVFTFLALWLLPSVKTLFIATSMAFTLGIVTMRRIIFPVKKHSTQPVEAVVDNSGSAP